MLYELRPHHLTSFQSSTRFQGFEVQDGDRLCYNGHAVPSNVMHFLPGRPFPVLFCAPTRPQALDPETIVCTEELGPTEPELVVVGGYRPAGISRTMYGYNFRLDKWRVLPAVAPARAEPAVVAMNDEIYCLGGKVYPALVPTCDRYSVDTNCWNSLAPMREPRWRCSAVVADSDLVVVGGEGVAATSRTTEFCDGKNWRKGPDLLQAREEYGVAVMGKRLYVCGGLQKSGDVLATVEMYDPATGKWRTTPPMVTARCFFGLAAVGEGMYAIGGVESLAPHTMLRSVERYDCTSASWRLCRALPHPLYGFSTLVKGTQIYAIGGHNGAQYVKTILIYDTVTDTWSWGTPLPEPLCHNRSAIVWTSRTLAAL